MALALADSLWHGDGTISLDARADYHKNHGLQFYSNSDATKGVVETLSAKPRTKDSKPVGTFGVWLLNAKNIPFIMSAEIHYQGTNYCNNRLEIGANLGNIYDEDLPDQAITLLDCLKCAPELSEILQLYGYSNDLVRATVSSLVRVNLEKRQETISYIFHPASEEKIEKASGHFSFVPSMCPYVNAEKLTPSGLAVKLELPDNFSIQMKVPNGFSHSKDLTYFFTNDYNLNEFGYMYVGLFILSNFVRYLPQIWMSEIQKSTNAYTLIDHYLSACESRLPWTILSSLSETVYIEAN